MATKRAASEKLEELRKLRERAALGGGQERIDPVSYTHLTLPTIYSV